MNKEFIDEQLANASTALNLIKQYKESDEYQILLNKHSSLPVWIYGLKLQFETLSYILNEAAKEVTHD